MPAVSKPSDVIVPPSVALVGDSMVTVGGASMTGKSLVVKDSWFVS